MTERVTKLMQLQTIPSGVVDFHQRHCHDTAIQAQSSRLMQRLQLPEQHLRRYTGGILQPGAIAQRFNLRRVELTEWGQVPEVRMLPDRLQRAMQSWTSGSTPVSSDRAIAVTTPFLQSSHLEGFAADHSLNSQAFPKAPPSTEPAFDQMAADHAQSVNKAPSARQSSSSAAELDQAPSATFQIRRGRSHPSTDSFISDSTVTAMAKSEPNSLALLNSAAQVPSASPPMPIQSFNATPSYANPFHSPNSQAFSKAPSALPEFDQTAAAHDQSARQSSSLAREPNQTPIATFQIRRGRSHPSTDSFVSDSTVTAMAKPEPNSLALLNSATQVHSASPPISIQSFRILPSHTNPFPLTPDSPTLKLPSPTHRPQATTEATTSSFPLSVKVKSLRSQPTPERTNTALSPLISVKSQLERTNPSLPPLISAKSQPRLPTAPTTTEPSPALPLLQKRHFNPLPDRAIEEPTTVSSQSTSQQQHTSSPPANSTEYFNINKVAEEVSRLLSRRLMLERDRRGIRP